MDPRATPSCPRTRRLSWAAPVAALVLGALVLGACVFGFRGDVEFADEASLAGLDTVQLHLPATELILTGEGTRSFVDWQGTWVSLGGSGDDALASARKAELTWETWGAVGRLSPVLPVEIREITSLDHLDVQTAGDLAHEIVGTGDVFVSGVDAYVSVDLDGGSVEILGGTEQLRVTTARGSVRLSTSAAVDVYSGIGTVTVNAEAARDLVIDTTGSVTVMLADVDNYDIDIEGAGELVIELDTAAHVGAGSYRRSIGPATNKLHIRAGGGRVELGMLAVPDPPTDP
ncbi:hypothetical protein [Enhygromyxa salina]|uniref:Adhesin domain-containing protein n=1 Tax=Enhygromyxa salina TaxID=215803 RepID=A0A2S9YQC5_9BACT|nr:hypothetical protein [Enhygromyxa salina]PRQ07293.1 hypothetical protein ENSA7_30030 [Enhygromyxa salina]